MEVADPETILVDTLVVWSPPIWPTAEDATDPVALLSDDTFPDSFPPKINGKNHSDFYLITNVSITLNSVSQILFKYIRIFTMNKNS